MTYAACQIWLNQSEQFDQLEPNEIASSIEFLYWQSRSAHSLSYSFFQPSVRNKGFIVYLSSMHSKELIELVRQEARPVGPTKKCSDFGLAKSSVRYMIGNNYNGKKEKRRSKPAIGKREQYAIKVQIMHLEKSRERVTASKIIRKYLLQASRSTVQRALLTMEFV